MSQLIKTSALKRFSSQSSVFESPALDVHMIRKYPLVTLVEIVDNLHRLRADTHSKIYNSPKYSSVEKISLGIIDPSNKTTVIVLKTYETEKTCDATPPRPQNLLYDYAQPSTSKADEERSGK